MQNALRELGAAHWYHQLKVHLLVLHCPQLSAKGLGMIYPQVQPGTL